MHVHAHPGLGKVLLRAHAQPRRPPRRAPGEQAAEPPTGPPPPPRTELIYPLRITDAWTLPGLHAIGAALEADAVLRAGTDWTPARGFVLAIADGEATIVYYRVRPGPYALRELPPPPLAGGEAATAADAASDSADPRRPALVFN